DPLVDRGAEPLRDYAADDFVDELVALMTLERLEHDVSVAELPTAACLLLVAAVRARLFANRLQVRDTGLVQLDVRPEPALDALDGDLDVYLAQTGKELLAGLGVAANHEGRVLLGQAPECRADLLLVALRLRSDGEAHHRLGKVDLRRLDFPLGVEQEV